ncbi:hypothetical protein [Paraprevotella xylaniphila]|uniref:hypothetical protein n=1 Tax=Paraprevotella xylaniphila TaxID=454155 RepID=UPI003AB4995B
MKAKNETLKNAYLQEIAKAWGDDVKMMAYFNKKVSDVYELTGGKLFAFEKPEIKTRFCFGCGQFATATDKEIQEADTMVERAYNDESYFTRENLKEIDNLIKMVELGKPANAYDWERYVMKLVPVKYCGAPALNVWEIHAVKDGTVRGFRGEDKAINCNDEDKTLLLAALNKEREKLVKRIGSYLKRHGLRNIRAWSYIRD